MDHVLSHIPYRELPVQSPIYELVWIERPGTPPVEKEIPVNVAGSAVRGDGTDPLTFAFGRITPFPGLPGVNFAGLPPIIPLPAIGDGTRPLMDDPHWNQASYLTT